MDKEAFDEIQTRPFDELPEARWPRFAVLSIGVLVFLGGFISFLGWLANIPRLTDWDGTGISIQPNTTVNVMAAGAALLLVSAGYRRIAAGLALFVGLVGFTALLQNILRTDFGINTFLMFGREWGRGGLNIPGLMGFPGSISWTLIGVSLLLFAVISKRDHPQDFSSARHASVVLALISLGLSSLSLIGFIYGAKALYTITAYTAIAFQTAIFIFAISLGIVFSIRESGPMRLFNDLGPAGILTRRLVPPLIILPILIGAIRLIGERIGYYDLAFGSAMRTVVEIGLLLTVVWWAGTALGKQAKRVEESQKTVRQLADAMPQVVWMSDSSGAVEYYNDRASEFAGIRKTRSGKYDWQPGLHPDDLEATIESWKRAVERSSIYAQEHRILMADGTFRWHLSRAIPAAGGNGDEPKWFGTATDIHDLKTAEYALRESEQRFARFMQNLPGLAWIKDREGRYVFANDAAQKAFGKTTAELYGKTDHEIFSPETAAAFIANDKLAMEAEHGRQTVEALKDDDGVLRYSLVNKFPIHVNGEPSLIGGIAIDITEQKTAQDSQEFLFRIADKIRVARNAEDLLADIADELGIFLHLHRCLFNEIDLDSDLETVHRDYSRTGESIAGRHKISDYSSVNSASMSHGNTIVNNDSENDPRTAEYFEKTYGPNKEIAYVAVPMMREGRWVASLWCSDDRPREWTSHEITLIENIAERAWAAVERLRADVIAGKLAAIVQSSDDAIISKDLNGIITSWNRGAEKIFGYTESEAVGKPVTLLIPEERLDEEPTILGRIRKGESIDHYETVRRRKDGTLLDISLTVSPIYDAEGSITGASKVARDITDRKAAEKEIRMISRMPEENPNPVMRVTPAGEILYANPAAKPVIRYWDRVFGKQVPDDFRWCVSQAFETRTKQTIDIVYEERFLSCNLSPVPEAGYVNVYADDTTDRQKAEEAMRLSEDRYRTLFDSMDEGYCIIEVIFDKKDNPVDYLFVEVNRAFEKQSGMHDVVGKRMLEFVSDIESHWLANYGRVAKTGIPVRFDGEYKGLDRFFEVYAFRIGEDGSNKVAVLFTDITARINASNALRISEERYRALTELSPQFVFMCTREGSITYVNQFTLDFCGRSFDEMLGDGWAQCIHPDFREAEFRKWQEALNSGREYESDVPFLYHDGTYRTVYARAQPIIDEDGQIPYWIGTALDVEDRKQAQERLRASETQLRLVTDAIPALVSYIDKNERYQFVNRQYSEWFGKPREQFVNKKMRDVMGARAYGIVKPFVAEALSGTEVSFDSWLNYKDAGQRYVHVSYVPDRKDDGSIVGLFALVSDLSDLKRSEDLLRASQERMRLMTESFTDYAIISTDNEGRIDSWNPGAEHIFGYSEQEIIGQSSELLFTPEDVVNGVPLKEMRDAHRNGRASDERWHVRKDGSRFFASGVMVPLYVGKVLTGYAKITADLTERKRNAEALQRAHDEMEVRVLERTRELAEANAALRAEMAERRIAEDQKIDLLKRLVTSQEDERRRIARDLHDQLGQRLTALRLKIASLREVVGENQELKDRTNRLQEIGELLDSEVSFLAWELRPSAIEELGLTDAIGTFAREWSRHYGIRAEFHSTGMARLELDPEADTHLYRIAQEALNNIVKHAKANEVNILLEHTDGEIILIVEDDGRGFDRNAAKRSGNSGGGLGLTGMEERASLIGGNVEIESTPGSGTTIFARIPLKTNGNKKKR